MSKFRPILHLIAKINGISYVIGTLRFQKDMEFSYFMVDNRYLVDKVLDLDTGEMTSPFEHITWHRQRVHIKRKDNTEIEAFEYQHGQLIADQSLITPLYVESIYMNKTPCLIKKSEFTRWNGSQICEVLSIESSKGFSMVFILVPSSIPTPSILLGVQIAEGFNNLQKKNSLATLLDINHRTSRITLWENWDMLVLITPFLSQTVSPIPASIDPGCRSFNYKNVAAALTNLVKQAFVKSHPELMKKFCLLLKSLHTNTSQSD